MLDEANDPSQISQEACNDPGVYEELESFVPGLTARLSLLPPSDIADESETEAIVLSDLYRPPYLHDTRLHPFSCSRRGEDYTGFGCFQIGLECTFKDFQDLVEGQRRLRQLNMLDRIKQDEFKIMAKKLRTLCDASSSWAASPANKSVIEALLQSLDHSAGDDNDGLRIYVGLHAGFRKDLESQFWGLYDADAVSGATDIYISRSSADRVGILLHTYMSSRGFNRTQCLKAELALAELAGEIDEDWELPKRFVRDIEQLTPTEIILQLRRVNSSDSADCLRMSKSIAACCKYQLIQRPTLLQLRALNTSAYLRGEISAEGLIHSRLAWYHKQGCWRPDFEAAHSLFEEINANLPIMLMSQQAEHLSQLENVLQKILRKKNIDAGADILALSVYCAFRRLAVDEVYLEILDRNPLPNQHSDQAACFAEMFATGSQCESYLDMTPKVLGSILAERYHAYYMENQPPYRDDKSTEQPTAYASKLVDEDPEAGRVEPPVFYRITFLGIFAMPALIDILLLTTIGRGLYISTYMGDVEKKMATLGLFIGLLTCGAIGTWIASGGSYYLHAMAFPAMNMFVLTRFVAGVAICLAIGGMCFIIIGIATTFYAGFIFFFYFTVLATYLTMLAMLSIYQWPGFAFQSGRTTVVACIPLLFISPLLTLWVGHDIVVYPCVLSAFLVSLIFGARKVLAQWSCWYLEVPCASDTDIVNWYTKICEAEGSKPDLPEGVTDLAATPLPREALMAAIVRERERRFWKKSTADDLVRKLADGLDGTMFIMGTRQTSLDM